MGCQRFQTDISIAKFFFSITLQHRRQIVPKRQMHLCRYLGTYLKNSRYRIHVDNDQTDIPNIVQALGIRDLTEQLSTLPKEISICNNERQGAESRRDTASRPGSLATGQ